MRHRGEKPREGLGKPLHIFPASYCSLGQRKQVKAIGKGNRSVFWGVTPGKLNAGHELKSSSGLCANCTWGDEQQVMDLANANHLPTAQFISINTCTEKSFPCCQSWVKTSFSPHQLSPSSSSLAVR